MPDPLNALFTTNVPAPLAMAFASVDLNDRDILFKAGDDGDALYVIDSGTVRIEYDGGEVDTDTVLARLGAGELLGELALLDGGKRSASAVAEGAVQLRRLDRAAMAALANDDPQVAIAVWHALGAVAASRLRDVNTRLAASGGCGKDPVVERMVAEARAAQRVLAAAPDDRVEELLLALATTFAAHAGELAELSVRVTGIGDEAHKTRKNLFASMMVHQSMLGKPGCGILGDAEDGVIPVASAAGVIFGLVPVTNPAATAIFKSLICLKSRNALILSFARRASEVGERFGQILAGVLADGGWPPGVVQVVARENSRRRTEVFFQHPGVDLILATGGPSMVKAAYSSGRPALGVGAGNAPCLVCADADVEAAATMVVESKSFDHGLICGSEHHLLVEECVADGFAAALEANGAAVLTAAEAARFRQSILTPGDATIRRKFIGRPAAEIAAAAGIIRSHPILLVVVAAGADDVLAANALAREKMAPVLSLYHVADTPAGIALAQQLLAIEGSGHTAAIHTGAKPSALAYAEAMPASRILVNSPATQGVIGLTTGLPPSLTLGCGYFGGNSTNDNVTFTHLRNVKHLAFARTGTADSG